jgi:hypothetical protein
MSPLDTSKISDTTELLPPLDSEIVQRLLIVAHKHWIASVDYIDPAPRRSQVPDKLGLTTEYGLLQFLRSEDRSDPLFALTTILSTPRALKRLVHDVERSWKNLKGEAELADLILVYALRNAVPEVIAFLERNLDAARHESDRGGEQATDRIENEWRELVSHLEYPREVQALVDRLGIQRVTTHRSVPREAPPQDISNYEVTDYFRRILAGSLGPGELPDQVVLKHILAWRDGESNTMITALVAATETNDRYVRVWEYFQKHLIDTSRLFRAASEVHQLMLVEQGAAAFLRRGSGGTAVWRQIIRSTRHDSQIEWLVGEIASALPVSLAFASELYYFYAGVRNGIVSANGRADVRARWVATARRVYSDTAALIRVLSPSQPYAIAHFITPPVDRDPPDSIPVDELRWFAELLVEAVRVVPSVVATSVLAAFGNLDEELDLGRGQMVYHYTLRRGDFEAFFGPQTDLMLRLLTLHADDETYSTLALPQIEQWRQERGTDSI